MHRFIGISIGILALYLLSPASAADAGAISRNNPYRSFNLTGVNYASMQWERKYGNQSGKRWASGRSNGRWLRRR